jgi:hypothetical protein
MPRNLRVALLTLVLVGGGLLAAVPAQAERFVHHDKAGDVMVLRLQTLTEDSELVRAPHRKQGDYVKVKMWHQVRAVRVVGKFRSLDRRGSMSQFVFVRTPDEIHFFQVAAGHGMWKGVEFDDSMFDDPQGELEDPTTDSPCLTHRINYARDRFSMRISRACLGRPAWVKVGVAFLTLDRQVVGTDQPIGRTLKTLEMSPRLVHGDPR